MKIQSVYNGGIATVSEEYGQRLIASGDWKLPERPKPVKKAPAKAAKAPETEED